MSIIAIQEPIERLEIDHQRMSDLIRGMPLPEVEDFFFDTVEDIAQAIGRIEQCLETDDFQSMYRVAGRVREMASRAGFMKLSHVAADLQIAITTSNHIALSAISQRLMRVGEQSLLAMWDSRIYSS